MFPLFRNILQHTSAEKGRCMLPGAQVHRPEDVVEDFRHPLLSQKLERHRLLSRSKQKRKPAKVVNAQAMRPFLRLDEGCLS